MFPYLDNALSFNWLQLPQTVTNTVTPTGIDLVQAVGPVGMAIAVTAGGTGTLSFQPVMASDNATFVNVAAADILDPTTGLPTTFANIAGAAGGNQIVYLKRDDLRRYVSITETNVGAAGSVTLASIVLFVRAYTSTAV